MGNGKIKWDLRFTVYNEEHIFFIDIRVFFQKRSVAKYPRISPGFKRGIFVNVTRLDQSRASKYLMDYNRGYVPCNIP